jgi:hypothetical protein
MKVEVQIYGPMEIPNYGWLTIGVFDCKKIETSSLRKKALRILNKSSYSTSINVARLVVHYGNEKIKITIPDIMQEV